MALNSIVAAMMGFCVLGLGVATGQDYLMVNRVRFQDRMLFDRPVEAFSVLFPKGWKTEGGVRWGSVGGCRGELTQSTFKGSSSDGAMQFEALPVRSFGWSDDRMLVQSMMAGAQAGGCAVNQPFSAEQYVDGFARKDLRARASNIRVDEAQQPRLQVIDQQFNQVARQSGGGDQMNTVPAVGDVTFADGSEGILSVIVINTVMRKPNYFGGGSTTITSTMAITCLMRFPASRRQEGSRMMNMIMMSHRVNPVWKSNKEQFMTQLGNAEHRGRMEAIRLKGVQIAEYGRAQNAASDQRMRNWENRQASDDRQHKSFVQAIREVETWRDGNGGVELSAGYNQAWSRGDGSYILSNKPGFDPSSALQDQNWKPMQRER